MATAISKTIHKPAPARKIIKRTVDILFTVLLLLAVVLAVYIFQNKKTNGQVQIGGYQLLIVLSGSMSPTFDTGSVVLVQRTAPEDIAVGDVITFPGAGDTGKTITHRVIAIETKNGLSFTTKGDANNVADSVKQDPENIIGKVRYSIPYIGYFLEFSRTKTGIYLLIVLPSLIIFMLEIRKVIGYMLEKRKEKKNLIKNVQDTEKTNDQGIEFINQELRKKVVPADPTKIIPTAQTKIINSTNSQNREPGYENTAQKTEETGSIMETRAGSDKTDIIRDHGQRNGKDIDKTTMDLLSEVQNNSTQEIYQYRIQAEKTRKELHDKLGSKLQEEKNLDRSIQQIREELLQKLNI